MIIPVYFEYKKTESYSFFSLHGQWPLAMVGIFYSDGWLIKNLKQGIDGYARKPALRKDTGYMVEKTYHIPPYLGPV